MRDKNIKKNIFQELKEYCNKDHKFNKGNILGSMCTQPHPVAIKAYQMFFDTNLGDPNLFPGSKEIENEYKRFLFKILNAPPKAGAVLGSGGTESNLNAIWLAKKLTGKKQVLIPKSAHFSFKKIASLMDIKLIEIPINKQYQIDISKTKNAISKDTAAVVGIAGSTELGTIDPIQEISEICQEENIYLHIDAAFGGFVLPFLEKTTYDVPKFDFRLKGVSSITIDSHKMGYSVIPLGSLIVRKKKWLNKISVETPYISCDSQIGILSTRSGGPVAAAYAVSRLFGINGYKNLVKNCMNNTDHLQKRLEEINLKLYINPIINVIAVKLKNLDKIVNELDKAGWKVNKMKRISSIRIVVMPHVTKNVIDDFIPVLEKICKKNNEI